MSEPRLFSAYYDHKAWSRERSPDKVVTDVLKRVLPKHLGEVIAKQAWLVSKMKPTIPEEGRVFFGFFEKDVEHPEHPIDYDEVDRALIEALKREGFQSVRRRDALFIP